MTFQSLEFSIRNSENKTQPFSFPMNQSIYLYGSDASLISRTIKTLALLEKSRTWVYKINGKDIETLSPAERYQYQTRMGYAFDQGGLISNCSLQENLTLPLVFNKIQRAPEALKTAAYWAEVFGFSNAQAKLPAHTSLVEQKSCILARALILDPECLFLDNPTHGLDQKSVDKLIHVLKKQKKETCLKHIFMNTDNPTLTEAFAGVWLNVECSELILKPNQRGNRAQAT